MTADDSLGIQIRSTHRRAVLLGGVLPIIIAAAATALMLTWLPQLPDPIAVHWSGAGADGFGPALPFIVAPLGITVIFSIFAVAMSWRTSPSGTLLYNQKILLTAGVWLAVLLSVGFGGSVAVQRGLTDAKDAPGVGPLLAVGLAAGVILAVAVWFVLPRGESSIVESGAPPKRVDVRGDERLSWSHVARLGPGAVIVVSVALAIGVAAVVWASLSAGSISVVGIVVLAFITVLIVTNTWWRVSADRRGFTVRGAVGWPFKRIPLRDIRTVQVVEIHPTRDFGGYGWRWTVDGRSGVILRAGPGIEVTVSSGKRFVVTVDDAETGAGVLAALLSRAAPRGT